MSTIRFGGMDCEVFHDETIRGVDVQFIDLGSDWMIGYRKPITGVIQNGGVLLAAGKTPNEAREKASAFLKRIEKGETE